MSKSNYRPDIDGLRAVAVLLVTIFHINDALIPGGFVGVDVFFVISGYLITAIIVREHREGTFSFSEFYRRRVRRILPAMFAVTFATLAIGTVLFLPEDVEHLAWSALATSTSTANIFFTYFLDTSYFAPSSATIPMLHMWSLGIEEQFYLLWPLILLLLLRRSCKMLLWLAALVVSSIAIGEWQIYAKHVEWAYYMLPSRVFQLVIGGVLVFLPVVSRLAAFLLAPSGMLLVFASAFTLTGSSPFPGLNAIPVTIGTAAILASGAHSTPVSLLLSLHPLRAIGLISYSLYLWHWPVLAFQRYFYGELDPIQQVLSLVAMTGLATASYFLIELPFRRSPLPFKRVLISCFIAPTSALGILVLGLIVTDGYGPYRYTDYPERLTGVPTAAALYTQDYVCQRPRLRPIDVVNDKCVVGNGDPRILLYGDSNAAHYVGIVGELARKADVPFRNYAHSGCAPIGSDPTHFVSSRRLQACISSHETVIQDLANYDIIFLGGAWPSYSLRGANRGSNLAAALRSFVNSLIKSGAHVVLLDTMPQQSSIDPQCGRKALKLDALDCRTEAGVANSPAFTAELHKIAENTPGVSVLSVRSQLCQFGRCPAFDDDGTSLYFDRSHLSAEGSWRVGRRFVSTDQAKPFIEMMRSVKASIKHRIPARTYQTE